MNDISANWSPIKLFFVIDISVKVNFQPFQNSFIFTYATLRLIDRYIPDLHY